MVGHSLGTITAIRALGRVFAEQPDARLGSLALVASFVDPVAIYPELDPFTVGLPELPALAARIDRRLVLRSDFDPEVRSSSPRTWPRVSTPRSPWWRVPPISASRRA